MSDETIVLIAIAAWVALGVALTLIMGRRGHNPFGWAVLGALLGPFAVLLAVEAVLDERRASRATLRIAVPADGSVDVMVGIDGSPEATGAMHAALDILGPRVRRLTLVAVRPYDEVSGDERPLRAELDRHAELVEADLARVGGRCGVLLLTGRPADELLREAHERGYDLLVVGARGRGLTKALLGSVATQLSSKAKVPVLIASSAG